MTIVLDILEKAMSEHQIVMELVKTKLRSDIELVAQRCKKAVTNKQTIFFMGNGGSAADSQHLAAELVGRFVKERKGLPALALTTDTSILTAVGNDYGYDEVFSRQVEALVRPNDIVIGITTSGNSSNILHAMVKARELGAITVGLTGKDGGMLKEISDHCIVIPSNTTARIQEAHILIGHIICEIIDEGNDYEPKS
ncbi:D-sedoheptulose 7-phosphate isomerase [Robertmurraya kyonggiensis]|uniref:Phosphoheptose isomerase n=1 Tax=Robertmurraya kyonggiensis TaxID=1037680 RepID=A0A4U1D181_9BACI|nr:D-sedoheptulose 7-phosphate isomerase [Robertmurraya kyonggiensis]TKC15508.1 D-sedoheptulose 7-phosphate isomerase [Robertmurraya kyonggiensis]